MKKYKVSVVVPVLNQFDSLKKVLYGFSQQNCNKNDMEIIIIDDGSSDKLCEFNEIEEKKYKNKYGLHLNVIHQNNHGRARSRNVGIEQSRGGIIIFCDGDRVPGPDFINEHIKMHEMGADIVIGAAYDYFGNSSNMTEESIVWEKVEKFARLSAYYQKVSAMYDPDGRERSKLVWLSFLVGNSSIRRDVLDSEKFDERFREWGFEHFELAYRLYRNGYKFMYNSKACNYHIPHKRDREFYENQIKKNAEMLASMYEGINSEALFAFVYKSLSIDDAEKQINVTQ